MKCHVPENCCVFCEGRYLETPPEKARVVRSGGTFVTHKNLTVEDVQASKAEFRRVANFYEIVRYEYWRINYDHKLDAEIASRRDKYLSTDGGKEHVNAMVERKKRELPLRDDSTPVLTDSLFGGSHDLIIARRHYKPDATHEEDLRSSGDLSPDEHFQYFQLTCDAIRDLHRHNRRIVYVAVFQNWLAPAGASLAHLHKQVVGIDELGLSVERALATCKRKPNFFNEMVLAPAVTQNLVFAENDDAIALVEVGRRFPTIGIYAKGPHGPGHQDLAAVAIRGMSDLVHACHAALGNTKPCNEEWYYKPEGTSGHMPWHILLLHRTNVPAGFEHSTRIYINPLTPDEFCGSLIPALHTLRRDGKIVDSILLSQECHRRLAPLSYLYP